MKYKGFSKKELKKVYSLICTSRKLDEKQLVLLKQGKGFFHIGASGHEAVQVAAGLKKEIKIYGKDFSTKDGTCVRDFIHVMDVAVGHVVAYEYLLKNKPQIINLNLGTGKGTSVLEIISIFEKNNYLDHEIAHSCYEKSIDLKINTKNSVKNLKERFNQYPKCE